MSPLSVQLRGGAAHIVLTEPDRLNALSDRMWEAFGEAVRCLRDESPVRVVTLTGSGRAFCAGGDIQRMRAAADDFDAGNVEEYVERERARQQWIDDILCDWVGLDAVRVVGINGFAIGAGLSLALSGDVRVMARDAWLDTGFVRLGLPGDCGITFFLRRCVGEMRARHWLLRPERRGSSEAQATGLVDEVVDRDQLDARLDALAESLASASAEATREIRRSREDERRLRDALAVELEATLRCKVSDVHRDAVRAVARRE